MLHPPFCHRAVAFPLAEKHKCDYTLYACPPGVYRTHLWGTGSAEDARDTEGLWEPEPFCEVPLVRGLLKFESSI